MANVTYLFGAGASYYHVPIVKEIPDQFKKFVDRLINIKEDHEFESGSDKENFQSAINDFLEFVPLLYQYPTIDTLAKVFYLTNKPKFNRLKLGLALFLLEIQNSDKSFRYADEITPREKGEYPIVDQRYLGFLAQIVSNEVGERYLPTNVNFISWNYDFQIEKSLNLVINRFGEISEKILKLNGSCIIDFSHLYPGQTNGNERKKNEKINKVNDDAVRHKLVETDLISLLLLSYEKILKNHDLTFLKFAFEVGDSFGTWKEAMEVRLTPFELEKTETLVIIGYSLPYFNREIDSFIIGKMKNLKKVYIQDLPEFEESLKAKVDQIIKIQKDKLKWLGEDNIEYVSDVSNFHIPFELDFPDTRVRITEIYK